MPGIFSQDQLFIALGGCESIYSSQIGLGNGRVAQAAVAAEHQPVRAQFVIEPLQAPLGRTAQDDPEVGQFLYRRNETPPLFPQARMAA